MIAKFTAQLIHMWKEIMFSRTKHSLMDIEYIRSDMIISHGIPPILKIVKNIAMMVSLFDCKL
jgi:hypothetical protein